MAIDGADIFRRCAERRRSVADLIESLNATELATPSLCAGWDIATVAGHLIVPITVPPQRFALTVLRHGGFHRASTHLARRAARATATQMADTLRDRADHRFTPPLHGPAAPLTDLCVHTNDMRVPLGLALDIRPDEAEIALDMLTGFSMFFLPRNQLRGIRISPDDLDRTWGEGAQLTGPAADVLMAVLGRRLFLDTTTGPGRDELARRR